MIELGLLVLVVRLRRARPCRRPVLDRRGGRGRAVAWRSTVAALPVRAVAPRSGRKDVGLVTQSWGGWAGDVAKAHGDPAADRRRPAARC